MPLISFLIAEKSYFWREFSQRVALLEKQRYFYLLFEKGKNVVVMPVHSIKIQKIFVSNLMRRRDAAQNTDIPTDIFTCLVNARKKLVFVNICKIKV